MEDKGITFFNFGGGCIVRLFVALDSLRNHYGGPVTLQLAKNDRFNEEAVADLQQYADIQWFDLERLAGRNLKSVLKPSLFKASPYNATLMLDGDLLIQRDPQPLLEMISPQRPLLVTAFSDWNCDGGRMRKRVKRCEEWLWPSDMDRIMDPDHKHRAINLGVIGWDKSGTGVLADWEWMTMKLAGQHIADEVACQCVYHRHGHYVAPETWNSSCFYGLEDPAEAAILHFHGNKHTSPNRPSSRRWIRHLAVLNATGKVKGMGKYLKWPDKALTEQLRKDRKLLDKALGWGP